MDLSPIEPCFINHSLMPRCFFYPSSKPFLLSFDGKKLLNLQPIFKFKTQIHISICLYDTSLFDVKRDHKLNTSKPLSYIKNLLLFLSDLTWITVPLSAQVRNMVVILESQSFLFFTSRCILIAKFLLSIPTAIKVRPSLFLKQQLSSHL